MQARLPLQTISASNYHFQAGNDFPAPSPAEIAMREADYQVNACNEGEECLDLTPLEKENGAMKRKKKSYEC